MRTNMDTEHKRGKLLAIYTHIYTHTLLRFKYTECAREQKNTHLNCSFLFLLVLSLMLSLLTAHSFRVIIVCSKIEHQRSNQKQQQKNARTKQKKKNTCGKMQSSAENWSRSYKLAQLFAQWYRFSYRWRLEKKSFLRFITRFFRMKWDGREMVLKNKMSGAYETVHCYCVT